MKNHRIYIDRPQTAQIKLKIANNYVDNIASHELMIEAINLQNKEIYALQSQYLRLLAQTQQAKPPADYSEQQRSKINTFELHKIDERKRFIQEGLKANEKNQKQNFDKEKASLMQVLANKQTMLKDMKGHEMNIFFNLEENILNELIEYAAKSEHVEEGKRLEFIEEIKWWKKRLEINENDLKQNL